MKYHQNEKKNLNWSNNTRGIQGFYFLLQLYAKTLLSLSANSASFFTLYLWPLNGIFWMIQFHSIYNGSDSLPYFLNTSWISSIFSLCVGWNTFFIRIFYTFYHSFTQEWLVLPSFENFPLFGLSTKIQRFCFLQWLKKKRKWNGLFCSFMVYLKKVEI